MILRRGAGALTAAVAESARSVSQFFPHPVRDVYGSAIVPETLGNVEVDSYIQHAPRTPEDTLASALRELVVRDGVASFFYHPFLGLRYLPTLVENMQAMGYTFTAADAMLPPIGTPRDGWPQPPAAS
jgi:uncharacterized protein YdaL